MSPRTRSTPAGETEPNLPRTIEDSQTVIEGTPSNEDVDAALAAIQERVRKLQKIKELNEQATNLMSALGESMPDTHRGQSESPD